MVFDEKNMISCPEFQSLFYDSIYPGMKKRGLVNADAVKTMFNNTKMLNTKQFNNMWRIIGLETWCQLFLDRNWCK